MLKKRVKEIESIIFTRCVYTILYNELISELMKPTNSSALWESQTIRMNRNILSL